MASKLVEFYRGGIDDRGRTLAAILSWPDSELERVHNFIQWLFPLPERSSANPSAPTLDQQTTQLFRSSPELQSEVLDSFRRMLKFYGLALRLDGGALVVAEAANFRERAQAWMQPGNHNHLRISRILRSLRQLGLEAEAQAFFKWLAKAHDREREKSEPGITDDTFHYWQWAMD